MTKEKVFSRTLSAALIVWALLSLNFMSCKKKDTAPGAPDVSNFTALPAGPYTIGSPGLIAITSTTLAPGTYTIKYHYRVDTDSVASMSPLVVNNGSGIFETPALTNAYVTNVYLDSITNSAHKTTGLPPNTLVVLTDSNGICAGKVGNTTFRGVSVDAELPGSNLYVWASYYHPNSFSYDAISIQIGNYNGVGTYAFNYYFLGGDVSYFKDTNGINTIDTALYGAITVTSAAPLLIGSFMATGRDSTKFTGSFTCPAP